MLLFDFRVIDSSFKVFSNFRSFGIVQEYLNVFVFGFSKFVFRNVFFRKVYISIYSDVYMEEIIIIVWFIMVEKCNNFNVY